jgi:hypothetical protein
VLDGAFEVQPELHLAASDLGLELEVDGWGAPVKLQDGPHHAALGSREARRKGRHRQLLAEEGEVPGFQAEGLP